MRKLFTKVIACAMAVAMALSATAVVASAASLEEYTAINAVQKEYYLNTYVPVYDAYREAVYSLREQIHATKIETAAQAQRIVSFLNELTEEHRKFYGTRSTEGKSRYTVPQVREAMYAAADDNKDYDTAITYCGELKTLVEARVNHLNSMISQINGFVIIETPSSGGDDDVEVIIPTEPETEAPTEAPTDDVTASDDDFAAYAAALTTSINAISVTTSNIDSGAIAASGSHANRISAIMEGLTGKDPLKYTWTLSLSNQKPVTVSSILLTDVNLASYANGTRVSAVSVSGSGVVSHGTAVVGSSTYEGTTYKVISNFIAD